MLLHLSQVLGNKQMRASTMHKVRKENTNLIDRKAHERRAMLIKSDLKLKINFFLFLDTKPQNLPLLKEIVTPSKQQQLKLAIVSPKSS